MCGVDRAAAKGSEVVLVVVRALDCGDGRGRDSFLRGEASSDCGGGAHPGSKWLGRGLNS